MEGRSVHLPAYGRVEVGLAYGSSRKGLAVQPTCLACGAEDDSHGHRWCRCAKVDEFLGEAPNVSKSSLRGWARMSQVVKD